MNKNKKIILAILALIIIVLVIGIISVNNKPERKLMNKKEFINNFETNKSIDKISKYKVKEEKNKTTYYFEDKYYLVINEKDNKIDKVYLYTKKDENYEEYLKAMIESIDKNLSSKEINKIFNGMNDIKNKKADKLGFLVNFESDGLNYITMEKEDGKMLSFFIYQIDN